MPDLKYVTFETDMGWLSILASEKGLLATTLPQPSKDEAKLELGSRAGGATCSPGYFTDLMERFKLYFDKGQQVDFPDELDLSEATPFQRRVWQAARLIPHGRTGSYLRLARQIDKPGAARAVGQAMGRNPFPIIVPCHRIIASNGALGGFSGGLEMKRRLLELESDGK